MMAMGCYLLAFHFEFGVPPGDASDNVVAAMRARD